MSSWQTRPATRRHRILFSQQIALHAAIRGLNPHLLEQHTVEHHYAAADRIPLVVVEAADCLALSGDVHACV